jgi:hypothetical protein
MFRVQWSVLHCMWAFGGNRFISKKEQKYRDAYHLFLKDEKLCEKYSRVFKGIAQDRRRLISSS